MKKITLKIVMLLSLIFISSSCEKTEYSPNAYFDRDTPKNINKKNITRLLKTENTDNIIRIAFTGDSQRFYDEAEDLVKKVNSVEHLDFLIHSGDISDFGLLQEFEWVDKIFSRLTIPYISVIGNHDMVAQGSKVYNYMYGEENFSFVYDSIRFVFHNTNSREFNFNSKVPDISFLKCELAPSAEVQGYIAISHVPPFDVDFDKALEEEYAKTFSTCSNFIVSLHGHRHSTSDIEPYEDGVRYINSNAVDKRQFLLIEVSEGGLKKSFVSY